jgi:hypothetical protein
MRDYEEFALPQAVASLLNTPRSLRHALGRTFSAWQQFPVRGGSDSKAVQKGASDGSQKWQCFAAG